MFTGLVEEKGLVLSLSRDIALDELGSDKIGWILVVQSVTGITAEGVVIGDSIAVNGVCLTVMKFDSEKKAFTFGCAPETMRRTNLGTLKTGSFVNLERALHASGGVTVPGRQIFGGHFVEGHVDGTAVVVAKAPDGERIRMTFKVDESMMKYIVLGNFICIDGISFNVRGITGNNEFFVRIIPFTQQRVVLTDRDLGETVNIELDILCKYKDKLAVNQSVDSEQVVSGVWARVASRMKQ
eukprot:TRINITY_DN80029_c0_g1_i1.p1 TRINITY_DN80029_c0_g1~~TRINITY_DN80029_c0_g1_i1.p1  ORF type:complete len:240 (-),score=53.65 TRINITY_DN80029_c0_g1_i1:22-741(-)